jgi:hypothetical protein
LQLSPSKTIVVLYGKSAENSSLAGNTKSKKRPDSDYPSLFHFKYATGNGMVAQKVVDILEKQFLHPKTLHRYVVEQSVAILILTRYDISVSHQIPEMPYLRHIEIRRHNHIRFVFKMLYELFDLALRETPVRRRALLFIRHQGPIEVGLDKMHLIRAKHEHGIDEVRPLSTLGEVHDFMPDAREMGKQGVALIVILRSNHFRGEGRENLIR